MVQQLFDVKKLIKKLKYSSQSIWKPVKSMTNHSVKNEGSIKEKVRRLPKFDSLSMVHRHTVHVMSDYFLISDGHKRNELTGMYSDTDRDPPLWLRQMNDSGFM